MHLLTEQARMNRLAYQKVKQAREAAQLVALHRRYPGLSGNAAQLGQDVQTSFGHGLIWFAAFVLIVLIVAAL